MFNTNDSATASLKGNKLSSNSLPYHYALRTRRDFVIGPENHNYHLLDAALGNGF